MKNFSREKIYETMLEMKQEMIALKKNDNLLQDQLNNLQHENRQLQENKADFERVTNKNKNRVS